MPRVLNPETPFWAVLAIPLLAGLMSWLVCLRLVHTTGRLLDLPNERSLHEQPTPRGGGLGILAGIALALLILEPGSVPFGLLLLTLLLGALSFLDDLYGLSALLRFMGHGIVAGLAVFLGLGLSQLQLPGMVMSLPGWLGAILAWLLLVWMTNLYNFMDGMDGFAGGMAVIGFGALGLLGWQAGDTDFALVCAVVVAASAGFLWFNFPPARLFMGDVGSAALGFLAGALMLWGARRGLFPLWIGLLVFSPFVVDATVTLVRRLLRGERVWQAHRSHCYQRLARSGWGHRSTVLAEYGLMLACAATALWVHGRDPAMQWGAIGLWCIVYALLMLWVERRNPFPGDGSRRAGSALT